MLVSEPQSTAFTQSARASYAGWGTRLSRLPRPWRPKVQSPSRPVPTIRSSPVLLRNI